MSSPHHPHDRHSPASKLGWLVALLVILGMCSNSGRSYASGILAAAYNLIQDEGVDLARRGTINFTGSGVTASDSGGVTVVNVPGSGGLANYSLSFTSQTSVSLTHNLGTLATITQCFDGSGNVVIPNNITKGVNTNTVTFLVATTGSCAVNGGGSSGGAIIGTSLEVNGLANSPAKIVGLTQSFIDFWYAGASKGQIGVGLTGPMILDSAGNIAARWDNGGTRLMTTGGAIAAVKYQTQANCASITVPSTCTSAPAGRVAIQTGGGTSLTVNTTAVAATSEIRVFFDASLGTALGITCDGTYTPSWVTSKTAATSFTFSIGTNPGANYACFGYEVMN